MELDHDTQTYANDSATSSSTDTELAQPRSRDVLRDLIVMREAHGADSAVGHHLSNLVELMKMPAPPAHLLKRQADGLHRAMRDVQ